MNEHMPQWIRYGLIALSVPQLTTGLWAILDPSGWYDGFPGGSRAWVAADGPYNHHLAGDAGAGFLATGVALVLGAVWFERRVVQVSLLTLLGFAAPHFAYHLNNNVLSGVDSAMSYGGLAVTVVGPIVLLLASRGSRPRREVVTA